MRSQFILLTLLLAAAILDCASGSLLRGDEAVRSPRRLGTNKEAAEVGKVGKKNNELQPKGSRKSRGKKEETQGDDPLPGVTEKEAKKTVRSPHPKAVEKGPNETQEEQIIHSHHPNATSGKDAIKHEEPEQIVQSHHPKGTGSEKGASKKEDKESEPKHSKKKRGKEEATAPGDGDKEQEEVESDNGKTETSQHVQSRGQTLNQTLYMQDMQPTIVGRPIEVLAIEYSTKSDQLPTEVETLYLVHLTEHLLSFVYSRTFESTSTVHYEGMEVQNYKAVTPRLIQFEITTLFQQGEGMEVPSLGQVKEVVQQDLAQSGIFYSEYLATLNQMPFNVFSTTTSFRVVTDADELQRLIDVKSGGDDKPSIFLIVAVIIAGLSLSICAIAKFRGAKIAKALQERGTSGSPRPIANFKTATFDDPITDGAYFVDEPDVENTGVKDMEEVDLNDDRSSAEWSSSDGSFQMPFRDNDGQMSTSDESQVSRNSISERSLKSGTASLSSWMTNTLKPAELAAIGKGSQNPGKSDDSKHSELELPESAETVSSKVGSRSLPIQNSTFLDHEGPVEEAGSILLPEKESVEQQRPIWMARRLRQLPQRESDESYLPDELPVTKQSVPKDSSAITQGSSVAGTMSSSVPLWMIKRQEIMQRRQQQPVQSEAEESSVEPPAFQSTLEDRVSSISMSVSDVAIPRVTNEPAADLPTAGVDHMNPMVDKFLSKAETQPNSTFMHVPLWMKKRQESMQQRERQSKEQTTSNEADNCVVEPLTGQSMLKGPPADASILEETNDPVSPVHSKMDPVEPKPVQEARTNATTEQNTSSTAGSQSPSDDQQSSLKLSASGHPIVKETTDPVRLSSDLRPDEPTPVSAMALWASNDSITKTATDTVSPTRSELGSDDATPAAAQSQSSDENQIFCSTTIEQVNCVLSELNVSKPGAVPAAQTNAAVVDKPVEIEEANPSTNGEKVPLWMKKRQELLQQSARQCEEQPLQIEVERPDVQPALSQLSWKEEGMDSVNLAQSERPDEPSPAQVDLPTDQKASMVEATPSTNDTDVPLWMKKRQEILLQNEEESVHDEESDEASITGAPAWMTRFKKIDEN